STEAKEVAEERIFRGKTLIQTEERAASVKVIGEASSMKKAVATVKKKKGFEHYNLSTAKRMRKMNVQRKRGRRINYEFEAAAAVLNSVMFSVLEKESDLTAARLVVLANICISHRIIQKAAAIAKQELRFKDDPIVNQLKFPRPRVAVWRKRNTLRRRRTTTTEKKTPSVDTVRERMPVVLKAIVDGDYD
ncbi:MAG: hypothetical protein SGPRY_004451, partial [Prymnesium sp.]